MEKGLNQTVGNIAIRERLTIAGAAAKISVADDRLVTSAYGRLKPAPKDIDAATKRAGARKRRLNSRLYL